MGYTNYRKQCPGLEFRLIPKLISWADFKPKKICIINYNDCIINFGGFLYGFAH